MIDVPVQVKDALKEGAYKKNYRFVVLNDDDTEDFTIDNENLVSESVGIDERMCSGDVIKFGLCEGSSLEFQYFGKQNITGREIQAFIDVDYEAYGTSYHNIDHLTGLGQFTIETAGEYRVFSPSNDFDSVDILRSGAVIPATVTTDENGTYTDMQCEEGDVIQFMWVSGENINTYLQSVVTGVQIFSYPIPMGFFTVQKCPRQSSTGIIKTTAYNKLMSDYLDQKANEFIDEYFADEPSVHIIDILNGLLGEFAIDPYEQTAIAPSQVQPTAAGGTSGTFRLKQLYGPHVFNISGWWSETRPTLSSNINLQFNYQTRYWSMSTWTPQEIANDGVRVHVPDDMDYIDNAVYTFLMEQFADNMTEATATSITNELMTFVTGGVSGVEMKRWGFCIRIIFRDDTEQYYGHTLYQRGLASGTFADLNKQTFFNVKGIVFGQYLLFNYGFAGMQSRLLYATGGEHEYRYSDQTPQTTSDIKTAYYSLPEIPGRGEVPKMADEIVVSQISNVAQISQKSVTIDSLADVSLRDLQSAVFETQCQFGKLDRVTDLFSGVELNHSRLLPQETLYPASDLYPSGAQESAFKSQYSKLWADEGNVHKWKYLIITYKGLDEGGNEKEYTLQRTVNNDGTDNYNCSDNWLFKNLTWTAEQVGEYADAMVEKMRDVTWFPFEMWAAGLPYLETGDEIEIPLGQQSYTSYVLQRQLKGIQNLQDTYINGTLDIF